MLAFINALLFVVVAEMGDKTQLLAMALAGKYKVKEVMTGVFIATVLNHAIAVAFGDILSTVIPIDLIRIIAAISFIAFGLWTIRGDSLDDKGEKKSKFGPIVTVAIAFFIAEFGDKTQLMTITLAAQYKQPLLILLGTTTGMMIADGLGIIGGAWLSKHVPEVYIKWSAAAVFMIFGLFTLYEAVPKNYLNVFYIVPFLLLLAFLIYLVGFRLGKARSSLNDTRRDEKELPGQDNA